MEYDKKCRDPVMTVTPGKNTVEKKIEGYYASTEKQG